LAARDDLTSDVESSGGGKVLIANDCGVKRELNLSLRFNRWARVILASAHLLFAVSCSASEYSSVSLQRVVTNQLALDGELILVEGYFCRDLSTNYLASNPCPDEFFEETEVYLHLVFSDTQLAELNLDDLHLAAVQVKGLFLSPPTDALVFTEGILIGSTLYVHAIERSSYIDDVLGQP
jgi:hypothetical protein